MQGRARHDEDINLTQVDQLMDYAVKWFNIQQVFGTLLILLYWEHWYVLQVLCPKIHNYHNVPKIIKNVKNHEDTYFKNISSHFLDALSASLLLFRLKIFPQ